MFLWFVYSLEVLRQLCQHVEQEASPLIQNSLETFLQQLVTDLKRCQEEQRNLEEALKLKDDKHEAQVNKLPSPFKLSLVLFSFHRTNVQYMISVSWIISCITYTSH
jgi:hypothetical protein